MIVWLGTCSRGKLDTEKRLWYNLLGARNSRFYTNYFFVFVTTENVAKGGDNLEYLLDKENYLRVKEVAASLNVSEVTVRKWIKSGAIKSIVVKSPRNGKNMYLVHKRDLNYFKENVFGNIYNEKNVPNKYKNPIMQWLRELRKLRESMFERIRIG